jgi:hypothetical protein
MKKIAFLAVIRSSMGAFGQEKAFVDFEAFEKLVAEVKPHRAARMLSLEEFHHKSQEKGTIILDTRSKAMYDAKHVKGAIHLNFSDFTQKTLKELIPDRNTNILIYCNNNFISMEDFFPTKMVVTEIIGDDVPVITLALNIPTYINLYGYGYKNVYELKDLISPRDENVKFEGTEVPTY